MKTFIKHIFVKAVNSCFIAMLFLSTNIMAYETGTHTKVTRIYVDNKNSIFVWFEPNALPGCFANKAAYLRADQETERLYAMLLSVKMTDKKIQPLYEYWGDDSSDWGRCYIKGFYSVD